MSTHRSTSKKQHSTDQRGEWRKYIQTNVKPLIKREPATQEVLSVLIDHMGEGKNWCWPSNETIARESDYSVATVKRATKRLHELGIITKVVRYSHDSCEFYWTPEYFEEGSSVSHLNQGRKKKVVKRAHARATRQITDDPLTTSKENSGKEEETQDKKKKKVVRVKKDSLRNSTNDREEGDSSSVSHLTCKTHGTKLAPDCSTCDRIYWKTQGY